MSTAQQEIADYADRVQADLDEYCEAQKAYHLADLRAYLYKDVEPVEPAKSLMDVGPMGMPPLSEYFALYSKPKTPNRESTARALSLARMQLTSLGFSRSLKRLSRPTFRATKAFRGLGGSLLGTGAIFGEVGDAATRRVNRLRLGIALGDNNWFISSGNCSPSRSERLDPAETVITTAEALEAMETISRASAMAGVTADEALAALTSDRGMLNLSSRVHTKDMNMQLGDKSTSLEKRLPVSKPPLTDQLEPIARPPLEKQPPNIALINWGVSSNDSSPEGLKAVPKLPDDPEYYKFHRPPVDYRDKDFIEWALARVGLSNLGVDVAKEDDVTDAITYEVMPDGLRVSGNEEYYKIPQESKIRLSTLGVDVAKEGNDQTVVTTRNRSVKE